MIMNEPLNGKLKELAVDDSPNKKLNKDIEDLVLQIDELHCMYVSLLSRHTSTVNTLIVANKCINQLSAEITVSSDGMELHKAYNSMMVRLKSMGVPVDIH